METRKVEPENGAVSALNVSPPETRKRKLEDEKVFAKEIISHYVKLDPIPESEVKQIPALSQQEVDELQAVLEIENGDNSWKDDWAGNLSYVTEVAIGNPAVRVLGKKTFKQTLLEWAYKDRANAKYIWFLICMVCNMESVPPTVKKILMGTNLRSTEDMEKSIRRVSYDPQVLAEDGWTTEKSREPIGAMGGPHLIGDHVFWDGSDAVVVAYIHDPDIGDLWKLIWLDEEETQSFDLEAEEVIEGKRKWERRNKPKNEGVTVRRTNRHSVSEDFTIEGVNFGIVLGASYGKGARPGVYWPARIMHASEAQATGGQAKRSAAKQKVDLVFLAPYWDGDIPIHGARRKVEGLSENRSVSTFGSKPLFHIESVEATDEMIKKFPYDARDGLDIATLRMSFRFTGLPKAVFRRFVDSHRLAFSLQLYAQRHLQKTVTAADRAAAGLFDSHPLSIRAPLFPSYSLNLPFHYMLSQLPPRTLAASDVQESKEPAIHLDSILDRMRPPMCWNDTMQVDTPATPTQMKTDRDQGDLTPWKLLASNPNEVGSSLGKPMVTVESLLQNLEVLKQAFDQRASSAALTGCVHELETLLSSVLEKESTVESHMEAREALLSQFIQAWAVLKQHGDEALSAMSFGPKQEAVQEWRRASERLYRFITSVLETKGFGNETSTVLSDIRCNGHRTSHECFERSVRLPAVLKAAKLAGAGTKESCLLELGIDDKIVEYAEQTLLPKVHDTNYLKRMKGRCAALTSDTETIQLTDASDGEGGCDTHGSRGTWAASVAAVAAAVTATNKVVNGHCVNAFCATRPPGHHAGRQLHPLKAVSNGFCILNAAASAAVHATAPVSEGGLGLRRVCVIDFDVHHGNGTQDILCSTFDPRYFFVSLHAGGPGVNGVDMEDDPNHELHDLASKKGGIFPGRCGDTSPHKGVLNIPLGAKVMAQNLATALLNTVTPAVNEFAPDLIVLSAGFDAHKNDPTCLGALEADAFGTVTEVCCQLAKKWCSGRLVSVLEGGYGVPCVRPQKELAPAKDGDQAVTSAAPQQPRPQPTKLLDLGDELPDDMDDQVPLGLQRRVEKCHAEGFIECVREHVDSLVKCNKRP